MENQSLRDTPRLGLWIATVIAIVITVFPVILRGAGPGNGGGRAADIWLTFGLALVPGSCVGLLQAYILPLPSQFERVKWFGITVLSTALGWIIVFAIIAYLDRLRVLPPIADELLPAILDGLLTGSLMGMTIGLVTGVIQAYILPLLPRQWIVCNLISWSVGVAIPVAIFFALLSQIDFFFL